MATPKGRFTDARLKVERAQRHVNEINAILIAYIQSDSCKIIVEEDPHTGQNLLKLVSNAGPPSELALAIGDAAHNLRASLDYVTSAIVGVANDRVHFPMQATREELVASDHLRRIEIANPKIAETILDEIKPYGADDLLFPLTRLDNTDKHKLLIPVFAITGVTGVNFEDSNRNRFNNATLSVGQGGILRAVATSGKIKINSYGKPIGDIFFPDGSVLAQRRVLPTIVEIGRAVLRAIEILEIAHFGETKT